MTGPVQKNVKNSKDNMDNTGEEDTISLLDLFSVIVKRRWLIIGATFVAAILVLGFSILTLKLPQDSPWNLLPNYYKAKVKILIQSSSGQKMIPPSLSETQSTLTYLLGGSIGKDSNLALSEELLSGNTIKDQIIREFNFFEKYHLEESEFPKTQARSIIDQSLEFVSGEHTSGDVFSLTYQDNDPVFAFQVLDRITEFLEDRFKGLTMERVIRKKHFIEERLQAVEEDLKNAQSEITEFKLKYGVLDISRQVQEQYELIVILRTEVIQKQMEIQSIKEYLSKDDPRIVHLQQEIESTNQFISDLRTGSLDFSEENIPQHMIPYLMARYIDLEGELDVQQAIYTTLRQEYESVKIDEADNSKIFQVIERAEIPEVKAGPSRLKICIIVTITAFFLSVFWAFVKEYFEKVKKDPVESKKLAGIRAMLRLKKRT